MKNFTIKPDNGPMLEQDTIKAVIIAAQANQLVVSRLVEGAMRALSSTTRVSAHVSLIEVSGALEIPLALNKVAKAARFNTFVALGAVIKGKTDHYEHVARMANDGVLRVALEHQLAFGNGILTVHSLEQALERADGPCGNLGFDATKAALSLTAIFSRLDQKPYEEFTLTAHDA